MDSQNEHAEPLDRQVKVFNPPANAPAIEMPESFYKLTPNEIKSLYKSQVAYREKLENRPLMTQKLRNAEEQERMKKYPKTTIRVRFPDSTILQAVFLTKEKVGDVYDFVRSTLATPERKFLLCLPPRTKLVDPEINLFKAGLAPASNVTFVWLDKADPDQRVTSALSQTYLDMMQPLPSPSVPSGNDDSSDSAKQSPASSSSSASSSSKKPGNVPKWLQKGLFNKK